MLLAGGAELPPELWESRTDQITLAANAMQVPRTDAFSTLLSTSPVLIWGGTDMAGNPVSSAELYVPSFDQFASAETGSSLLPPLTELTAVPSVIESDPSNGAGGVAISARIALRFSERLKVTTLNSSTVTLMGPAGQVAANVVPAEQGMLLFVTPARRSCCQRLITPYLYAAPTIRRVVRCPGRAEFFHCGAYGRRQ